MIVKNYIVENYREFMDELEKELCQKGISYVRIDNEIHFLDTIIRFIDFDIDRKLIYAWCSIIEYEKRKNNLPHLAEMLSDDVINEKSCTFYTHDSHNESSYYGFKQYQTRNKKMQKYESQTVKQKLKKYK